MHRPIKYNAEMLTGLLPFATVREAEIIKLRINAGGEILTWDQVSEKAGISVGKCKQKVTQVAARAAKRGYSPPHDMTHTVPDGFGLKGVSTYYDHEGKPRGQWVKSQADRDRQQEILLEQLETVFDTRRSPFKPTKGPKSKSKDRLALFPFTDLHVGGLSYPPETDDAPWDTDIAARVFLNALHDMIELAPDCDTAVLANIGDFLHFDGIEPKTSNPATNHIVDTDTRYARLVEITLRIVDEAVNILRKHYPNVIVLHAEGNHDEVGSIWLRKHCEHVWRSEPRVTVIDSDMPYYAIPWGDYLLAFHHSHLKKMQNLPQTFASIPRYRKLWGDSVLAYIHTGHLHHDRVLEDGGAIVRQHSTLSSTDAYAARLGLHSESATSVFIYDKKDGEVASFKVRPRP